MIKITFNTLIFFIVFFVMSLPAFASGEQIARYGLWHVYKNKDVMTDHVSFTAAGPGKYGDGPVLLFGCDPGGDHLTLLWILSQANSLSAITNSSSTAHHLVNTEYRFDSEPAQSGIWTYSPESGFLTPGDKQQITEIAKHALTAHRLAVRSVGVTQIFNLKGSGAAITKIQDECRLHS